MRSTCVFAVAATAFCGLSALAGMTLFFNTTRVPRSIAATHPEWQLVRIQSRDGVPLDAWWIQSPKPSQRCVVVLHGIGDSRSGGSGFAPLFTSAGYHVLAPDARGHGTSGGEMITYGIRERFDALDWAHWMQRAGCERVYGLGESLGASTLLLAAADEPVFRAIVAECPYTGLRDIATYRLARMTGSGLAARWLVFNAMAFARLRYGLDFDVHAPIRAIARTHTPVLLIHGLSDDQTPPAHSAALAMANPAAELWLVAGAGHAGAASADPGGFRNRTIAWFAVH